MALYQWISCLEHEKLVPRLFESIQETGLEIDPEYSSEHFIYARERDGHHCAWTSRVNILVSQTTGDQDEYLIEVRSSEPMLKKATRCEQVATKVKTLIPPRS